MPQYALFRRWIVVPNPQPDPQAAIDVLLIPDVHVDDLVLLNTDIWAELWLAYDWIVEHLAPDARTFIAHCGTGEHLTMRIIRGNVEHPDHKGVYADMNPPNRSS
jgi:hypothetical protein